jgi:hypothetical protein
MRISKTVLILAIGTCSTSGIARAQNATLSLAGEGAVYPGPTTTGSVGNGAALLSHPAKQRSLLRRIAEYPLEHKAEFAMGTGLMLARMADAATTVHGVHTGTGFEADSLTRFLIGRRPSNFGAYSLAAGLGVMVIGVNHVWMNRWYKGSDPWEFAPAFWTVPQIMIGAAAAQCNIDAINSTPRRISVPTLFHRESLGR